ncbi:ferrochelatase [Bacillus glycinifermentans]|uniref:Coproporphyrin III ferrochelatase n=1 Tax=Bacillus glycinifermentans TaxID=1664069 RepID=A0A0J6EJB7_9BACI|nr:ferrochelatase [Bacillus glycinifermentans]ATH93725.1 ferrochelatase [Bacillus glycinifermentans]KMM56734.1 ferrochelatase [Bacillus glycinifermentans]KRT90098.1 ferrochelatase [Bacillus glycinifermentans]MEC0483782.1 ferrochelatase [Bacillus glycinifermentans]MEC0496276.1 ferrochelatase [Bacillus glycinifermentans]
MERKKIGLLVMAYGTPYKEEDIIPYYTHIRHGNRPSEDMIDDLKKRYQHIGGISPLAEITSAQAKKLEEALNARQDDVEFIMYLGLKHISPFIEDAVKQMKQDQIEEAVSIVLAPHYSTFSTEVYNRRAEKAAQAIGGPRITSVHEWYQEEGFISYWSEEIGAILKKMPKDDLQKTIVICSAHSLPEKILEHGDPYPVQLEETAALIAERLSFDQIAVGWQSEGNTPDPWLGPDVQDLTRELYQEGFRSFIYAPVGFVSDHLEVLYDNDYECKTVTDELGADYYRPPMPNADPRFIDVLAGVVLRKLQEK